MKKAIIFGISGQDGFYLNKLLQQNYVQITGVARNNEKWVKGDVSNVHEVEHLIKQIKPDYVFHFAANSTTNHDALFENHRSIFTGTLNILETCYKYSRDTKIFLSGSAVQFQNNDEPIDETTTFAPLSPYAVSRIASVYAGRYYRRLGLKVYVGYFFNHDSPLRSERHVNQKIIAALKRIVKGSKEIIELGDVTTKKELNFAGDIVEAVWQLINQDIIYETVIGSGKAYTIEDWIKICFGFADLDWEKYIIAKAGFVTEYKTLVSNPRLIMSLGWKPKVSIEQLATMMYYN